MDELFGTDLILEMIEVFEEGMETLGPEFEEVLFENLWELFDET